MGLFNILLIPILRFQLPMIQALNLTAIFDFIASINYATTFYVYYLTSRLFQQEFYKILSCLWNNNRRIGVATQMIGQTTQTQIALTRIQEKKKSIRMFN